MLFTLYFKGFIQYLVLIMSLPFKIVKSVEGDNLYVIYGSKIPANLDVVPQFRGGVQVTIEGHLAYMVTRDELNRFIQTPSDQLIPAPKRVKY